MCSTADAGASSTNQPATSTNPAIAASAACRRQRPPTAIIATPVTPSATSPPRDAGAPRRSAVLGRRPHARLGMLKPTGGIQDTTTQGGPRKRSGDPGGGWRATVAPHAGTRRKPSPLAPVAAPPRERTAANDATV